jgi:glycosyltransferase involved in cell wall biosynthesis
MRILHAMPVYAPAWQFGGPVLSVSRLCEALAAEGVSVEVLTTNAGLPDLPLHRLGQPLRRNGVTVTYFPVDRQGGTIRSRALEQALPGALQGAQLLHISAIWQPLGIPLQQAALKQHIPVLHSLRGALGPYSLRHGWWKKLPYFLLRERPLLQRAAGLHVTSEQERRELRGLGLRAPRWLLPNPLDLTRLRPDPPLGRAWRRRLGAAADQPLLLICGRQHHKKGLDLLPEVMGGLRHLRWQLLLVGGDQDGSGAALVKRLQQQGLGPRLLHRPTLPAEDLGGIYNAADLLLLPSRHENFGNVVLEALACGAAVAISNRTGVAGDLEQGAPAGFGVVLPRHAPPWRRWLGGWLQQPRRASPAAAQWVAEHYGQQAVARQAIELYRRILQTHTSAEPQRF